MTLAEILLSKVSEWRPSGDGRHTFTLDIPTAGWSVGLIADNVETVGCLAWELSLHRTNHAPASITIRKWAEQIAAAATSLLEPLTIHEIDETAQVAVLRSTKPTVRGSVASYYEVVLTGLSQATVQRFDADRAAGTPRHQIAFAITFEGLSRLAGNITG